MSLAVVLAGFATSYYLRPISRATHYPAGQPISPSLPVLVHVLALLFSAWVGLLGRPGDARQRRQGDALNG